MYKFLLHYVLFASFVLFMMTLAGPAILTEEILTKESAKQLESIKMEEKIEYTGFRGMTAWMIHQIKYMFILLTLQTGIGWLSRILFIPLFIVLGYIFIPQIMRIVKVFTDFLGHLFGVSLWGTAIVIISLGAIMTLLGSVFFMDLGSEEEVAAALVETGDYSVYSVAFTDYCKKCVMDGKVWRYCHNHTKSVYKGWCQDTYEGCGKYNPGFRGAYGPRGKECFEPIWTKTFCINDTDVCTRVTPPHIIILFIEEKEFFPA